MSLLNNLLSRFYQTQVPVGRSTQPVPIYTIDMAEQIARFGSYHANFANPDRDHDAVRQYFHSLVEQMIAHFEYQNTAVQSFVGHYVALITEGVSPGFIYHPLRFLRLMSNEEYQQYTYCLYGFAEEMYNLLVANGMFDQYGQLRASFQGFQYDTLYLIFRPEVPDVFHL